MEAYLFLGQDDSKFPPAIWSKGQDEKYFLSLSALSVRTAAKADYDISGKLPRRSLI
jgi:hypothetical protein